MMTMSNNAYMNMALELAAKGKGRTSPNPMVGAVIVKSGRVIAEGYHRKAGTAHAEIIALKKAGAKAKGATLYVNLEPCCHTDKKTPPCTKVIITAGINKVIIAMVDPNPKVSGRGIKELNKAGVKTETGIMNTEAIKLNESFIIYITRKKPFVMLKAGQSIDGKIATAKGESKWITGRKSRKYVQELRNETDAVLVGIGTVKKDNPSLTCRMRGGRNPYRIIIDSKLKISMNARVLKHRDNKTIIATTKKASKKKIDLLEKQGNKVLVIGNYVRNKALTRTSNRVNLKSLMKELGKLAITSVMIEGGSLINSSALSSGIVDKVVFFIAPVIMGGSDAISSIGGKSPGLLKKALKIKNVRVKYIGEDILIEGYL